MRMVCITSCWWCDMADESTITIELKGLDKLLKTIKERIGVLASPMVGAAIRAECEIEMTEAKKRCPVDTGALRSTGHVEGPESEDEGYRTRMVFGGPAAPYAEIVHEDEEAFHKVGQWKYLESVLVESKPYMVQRIFDRVSKRAVTAAEPTTFTDTDE